MGEGLWRGGSRWLGCGTAIGRKMSRRPMVMVSGAGGLQGKGGRSPPPKRGRSGGGRCICDTLLSPSACSTEGFFAEKRLSYPAQQGAGKGFVKGESVPLDPVLVWGPRRVARPDGERRAHRSGEGCPECNGGSARLKRRLRPTRRCKRNATAASRADYDN